MKEDKQFDEKEPEFDAQATEELYQYITINPINSIDNEEVIENVNKFLQKKADPNSGLVAVCLFYHLWIRTAELLLKSGANPNFKNAQLFIKESHLHSNIAQITVLTLSCIISEKPPINLMEMLIKYGANPNHKNDILPPLTTILYNSQILLTYQTSMVDIKDSLYWWTIANGDKGLVKTLLPSIIDPKKIITYNTENPHDTIPLHSFHKVALKLLQNSKYPSSLTHSESLLFNKLQPRYIKIIKEDTEFNLLEACESLCFYNIPIIRLNEQFVSLCQNDQSYVRPLFLSIKVFGRKAGFKVPKPIIFEILSFTFALGAKSNSFYLNVNSLAVAIFDKERELERNLETGL